MTTTTAPTANIYQDFTYSPAPTADDFRTMADLLDLVGQRVTMTHPDGATFSGTLDKVYFTDGVAVNVIDGENFSFGPLYGSTVAAA